MPQYTSRCCSILLLGAQQWQWQTLTSPAVLCIPLCRFCSRQDSQFRVSAPLAFQQMQKMPSSRASRQASAQCTPRRGALREVLSEKHMNFIFCIIAWGPAIVFRTYLLSSHLPPAYLYTSLPSQDYRFPQSLTLQTTDQKFPPRPLRKENQARTTLYVHTTPSLFSSPSRMASAQNDLLWYLCFLSPASACPETSCPSQVVCLSALLIFKCAKFFWQHSCPSFLPLASYLLAALRPFFTNTRSVHIDHILIWNSLCSVTCLNLNKCRGKELFHVIIIENSLPVKSCYFHKDRDCLDPGSEVRFRSWGEWCVVIITLRIFAAFLIQRSETCLQYITTAGYVILCKLLPKFHNS